MSSYDLLKAASSGDLDTVRELVEEEGLNVNSRSNGNFTALHFAAENGHSEVVKFLLDSQAVANAKDWRGDTPLHTACNYVRKDDFRAVQLLIDHKADVVNVVNKIGRTPLHSALACGAILETVQCLLDHNADVTITDVHGKTPLHMVKLQITAPVMELLLSHGIDLHAKDKDGDTPLHALVSNNCVEAVRVIFDHISSSNDGPAVTESSALWCGNYAGLLPFHFAQSPEMAQVLLELPLLEDEDQVVPRVFREMLFAKDNGGSSLLDRQQGEGPLFDYLASFTDLPLTVVPERREAPIMTCEHRDKRSRHGDAIVPFHPNLNEFQRSIAKVFLSKWDQSFQHPSGTTTVGGADHEDTHAMLPDDVKYAIMAYLTPADIMKI